MECHASGAPQGGVLSPLLSNIYLQPCWITFVEQVLIPEYKPRAERVKNPAYRKVQKAMDTGTRTRRPG